MAGNTLKPTGREPGRCDPALLEAAVLETLKDALVSLDGSRVYNVLEEYRQKYGRQARETAFLTYQNWRDGRQAFPSLTASRLFDLLPRHLSEYEKLALVRCLRQNALERMPTTRVTVTLARPADLAAVVSQVVPLLRRVEATGLPRSPLLHGLYDGDAEALARIAAQADRLLATQRLAELVVSLTTLFRFRALSGQGVRICISARVAIPTANIHVRFLGGFWKEKSMNDKMEISKADTDQDFLVRLQDLALAQEWQDGKMSYVDFVMRTLTPAEQEKLRAIAVAEGLRTEILLRELHIKTLAAKADIDLTLATVQDLKEHHHHGRVISEHATASGTTHIEVTLETCPLLRPLTRWRKPKHLDPGA